MARIVCPACGFVHECGDDEGKTSPDSGTVLDNEKERQGYTLSYTKCKCGCGCGHTCGRVYGPYLKVQDESRRAEIETKVGPALKLEREANARAMQAHRKEIHEN